MLNGGSGLLQPPDDHGHQHERSEQDEQQGQGHGLGGGWIGTGTIIESLDSVMAIPVFVYGTLLRGQANHHWLTGAAFLGEASLAGVRLFDLGPFPMAVPGDGLVWGELYGVDDAGLERLDRLEGAPRLYERQWRSLSDGRSAWVYLGRARQVRFVAPIEDGRWRGRRSWGRPPG